MVFLYTVTFIALLFVLFKDDSTKSLYFMSPSETASEDTEVMTTVVFLPVKSDDVD